MRAATVKCNAHIPGNLPCPYPAFWRISFAINEPAAYEKTPPEFRIARRDVCSAHLEHALLRDLDLVPSDDASAKVEIIR